METRQREIAQILIRHTQWEICRLVKWKSFECKIFRCFYTCSSYICCLIIIYNVYWQAYISFIVIFKKGNTRWIWLYSRQRTLHKLHAHIGIHPLTQFVSKQFQKITLSVFFKYYFYITWTNFSHLLPLFLCLMANPEWSSFNFITVFNSAMTVFLQISACRTVSGTT